MSLITINILQSSLSRRPWRATRSNASAWPSKDLNPSFSTPPRRYTGMLSKPSCGSARCVDAWCKVDESKLSFSSGMLNEVALFSGFLVSEDSPPEGSFAPWSGETPDTEPEPWVAGPAGVSAEPNDMLFSPSSPSCASSSSSSSSSASSSTVFELIITSMVALSEASISLLSARMLSILATRTSMNVFESPWSLCLLAWAMVSVTLRPLCMRINSSLASAASDVASHSWSPRLCCTELLKAFFLLSRCAGALSPALTPVLLPPPPAPLPTSLLPVCSWNARYESSLSLMAATALSINRGCHSYIALRAAKPPAATAFSQSAAT